MSDEVGAIVTIKARYAKLIYEGKKTAEIRKRFGTHLLNSSKGNPIIFYEASPVNSITGYARMYHIAQQDVTSLWDKFSDRLALTRGDFDNYFKDYTRGFSILFDDVKMLKNPLPMYEIAEEFHFYAPTSHVGLSKKLWDYILTQPINGEDHE